MDASYTLNRTYDNSSFNCCIARTSVFTPVKDDPRDLSESWGPSDSDFRHKAVVSAISPAVWGFRFSARYVGQSGRPISAVIAGDVNGDDIANNDLAFVFDPDSPSTPENLREGMRTVLNNPDNRFRSYLQSNLGRIADRNGGMNPWFGQVDVRVSRDFGIPRSPGTEWSSWPTSTTSRTSSIRTGVAATTWGTRRSSPSVGSIRTPSGSSIR
jgi:hypothetical protein